jgi:hypothetical protein
MFALLQGILIIIISCLLDMMLLTYLGTYPTRSEMKVGTPSL